MHHIYPPLYREFTTQQQIDAMYNPSIGLADPNEPGAHFAAQAEKARTTLACHLDIPFGPTVHETLDIFPAAQKNAPVFVFIHGGYWRAFQSKHFNGVALGLQARGITTVVINYALCPFVTIEEIVRQSRAAVAWTVRNISQYGGDPTRVSLGGHSAGGHLTAMCLQTEWERDYGLAQDPLKAAVLVSGLYDLQPLRYSYLQPMIQLDEGIVRRNSPAFLVRASKTPIWITWGGAESTEFARQSQIYYDAWKAAGNQAELSAIPDANHFTAIYGFEEPESAVCNWLTEKLSA